MTSNAPHILLFGKTGQVGSLLAQRLQSLGLVTAIGRTECDLRSTDCIRETIYRFRPNIIVNAAAYNAVDQAEAEQETTYAINARAPGAMAECAADLNALLVHYSSDYVFDGAKGSPYTEDDLPNPLSVYGKSKWQGEQAVTKNCAKHLIFRTSWIYGPTGKNFLRTILAASSQHATLDVVADQIGTPTAANLIAASTIEILQQYLIAGSSAFGTYHMVPDGGTNRYEYAKLIIALAKQHIQLPIKLSEQTIKPITTNKLSEFACRPTDSRLSSLLLQRMFNLTLPAWQQDIPRTIQAIAESWHDQP